MKKEKLSDSRPLSGVKTINLKLKEKEVAMKLRQLNCLAVMMAALAIGFGSGCAHVKTTTTAKQDISATATPTALSVPDSGATTQAEEAPTEPDVKTVVEKTVGPTFQAIEIMATESRTNLIADENNIDGAISDYLEELEEEVGPAVAAKVRPILEMGFREFKALPEREMESAQANLEAVREGRNAISRATYPAGSGRPVDPLVFAITGPIMPGNAAGDVSGSGYGSGIQAELPLRKLYKELPDISLTMLLGWYTAGLRHNMSSSDGVRDHYFDVAPGIKFRLFKTAFGSPFVQGRAHLFFFGEEGTKPGVEGTAGWEYRHSLAKGMDLVVSMEAGWLHSWLSQRSGDYNGLPMPAANQGGFVIRPMFGLAF